jgi:hypothetical protein
VLALGALVLAACGDADSSPHAATTSGASTTTTTTVGGTPGPVPWAYLPPTHPHITSTRVPPHPDPAQALATRPCRARDLVLKAFGNGAAMGTTIKNLRFSLAAARQPCAVSGRPTLSARTVEGTTLPGHLSNFTSTYHQPVLLTRTARAFVQMVWPSVCFAPSGYASADVSYAGRTWVIPIGPLSRTCDYGPDRPLDYVGITAFTPPVPVPARRVTAYNPVRVHGPGEITARIDQPLIFEVTLTSPADLPLDPCPDYRLGASPGDGGTFGLNCAAIPYRDDEGRPYLPAGRPVTFEMHLDPVEALQKYWWTIIAPGSPPYVAGVITLR